MTGSTTRQVGGRSSASLPTYSDVAARLGMKLCGDGWPDLLNGNHMTGWSAYGMSTIHWQDRNPTRRGLRRFLKLVAKATSREAYGGEKFVILYNQSITADRLGRTIGVRFPRRLADADRAKVRFWLAKFRNDPIDREFPEQRELMRRIRRWARA